MPEGLAAEIAHDIVSVFNREVPLAVQEAIVRLIRDESRASEQISTRLYATDQAREARPWLRRAGLATGLLRFNRVFPGISVQSHRSSGSSYYVQLDVGRITLLCARAQDVNRMLPPAAYRTRIATFSAQYWLFEPDPPPPDARVYSVILYGGVSTLPDPEFIVVRFPTGDHLGYLDARIDLKSVFAYVFDETESAPAIVNDLFVAAVEDIQDNTRNLTLRSSKSTGSSSEK